MSYFGYGVDTSRSSYCYKFDAMERLWEKAKNIDWVKIDYAEYCSDNELDPDDEETYTEYMDMYEDASLGTGNAGTEGFIADVLNTLSGAAGNPFRYCDSCIFVEATLPENDADRDKMLTTERIRKLIAEHVEPLVYSVSPEWLLINE